MTKSSTNTPLGLILAILSIASMLLAGGIYLGKLENRVTQLELDQQYYHGAFEVPSPKGQ